MDDLINLSKQVTALQERVVSVSDKAKAAHKRIDKTEDLVRDNYQSIHKELTEITLQIGKANNAIYHLKGSILVILAIAGVLGSFLGNFIISLVFKN